MMKKSEAQKAITQRADRIKKCKESVGRLQGRLAGSGPKLQGRG